MEFKDICEYIRKDVGKRIEKLTKFDGSFYKFDDEVTPIVNDVNRKILEIAHNRINIGKDKFKLIRIIAANLGWAQGNYLTENHRKKLLRKLKKPLS